jgi:hypothetical protein
MPLVDRVFLAYEAVLCGSYAFVSLYGFVRPSTPTPSRGPSGIATPLLDVSDDVDEQDLPETEHIAVLAARRDRKSVKRLSQLASDDLWKKEHAFLVVLALALCLVRTCTMFIALSAGYNAPKGEIYTVSVLLCFCWLLLLWRVTLGHWNSSPVCSSTLSFWIADGVGQIVYFFLGSGGSDARRFVSVGASAALALVSVAIQYQHGQSDIQPSYERCDRFCRCNKKKFPLAHLPSRALHLPSRALHCRCPEDEPMSSLYRLLKLAMPYKWYTCCGCIFFGLHAGAKVLFNILFGELIDAIYR